jgi:hypothetical protein
MNDARHSPGEPPSPPSGAGHEQDRISTRGVVVVTMIVLGNLVVSVLLVYWVFVFFAARDRPETRTPAYLLEQRRLPAEPPWVETAPSRDLTRLRERERQLLHEYRWIDRDQGIARIPIDRAMQLLLQEGFPVRAGEPKESNRNE